MGGIFKKLYDIKGILKLKIKNQKLKLNNMYNFE